MFGTIRKHQTWLWAVIITLTIISFVIWFSPYSKMSNAVRRPGALGSLDGQRITEQQFAEAERDITLHYFLMTGHWPNEERRQNFDPTAETYKWLLLLQKQEQLGIHVSDDATAEMAKQLVRPFDRSGVASPTDFINKVLEPRGIHIEDFERFARHYVGLQELIRTVGLSGTLITPQEAKNLYEREHQELSTEAVFFNATNYLSKVAVSPQAVSQYYSNRMAMYGIPERAQVNYVRFDVTNFLPKAEADLSTNLNSLVEENYRQFGSNLLAEVKTPEAAKAKIREQLIRKVALNHAYKNAMDFANTLFNIQPERSQNLDELARTNGLRVGVAAPFDREEGPKDLEVKSDFTKIAFSLTPEEPFGQPIVGEDGVYVIALSKRLPHEIPSLDEIRDKVTADYKHGQAVSLAREAGRAFYSTLTNGLAQGKNFTNVCAQAGLKPAPLAPFSLSTRTIPEVEDLVSVNQLKQLGFGAPPGKPSEFTPTPEGGLILFVQDKLPFNEAKMQADLPDYINAVRRTRQEQAFNMWFSREYSRQLREGLRNTPVGQPQQPPPSLGSAAAKS